MRHMCAAMLSLQAIILGLSIPVMIAVQDIDPVTSSVIGGGLAVLCLVTAGLLRRPWAYPVGHAIQIATIATGFLVPIMFFIGLMFLALWLGAYFLGRKIEADRARWAAAEE